jgi:hypothetical protein
MNYRHLRVFLSGLLFWGIAHVSSAQVLLMGMVADSASMQALPNVNIVSKKTSQNTVSNIRGSFKLTTSADDTIVFSRVGYITKELAVARVKEVVIIFLKEEHRMLRAVEIEEKKPFPWVEHITPSPWRNSTNSNSFAETPGFQGIQTFGPGYIFKMPGSGFKKEARDRKRLQEVQQENDYARDYIHTVNGPEVKGRIMEDYGLSEEEFYRLLAMFNEKNKDFIYKLETHEVLPLLFNFYADYHRKTN